MNRFHLTPNSKEIMFCVLDPAAQVRIEISVQFMKPTGWTDLAIHPQFAPTRPLCELLTTDRGHEAK